MLDTLETAHELKNSGFTVKQAEALANIMAKSVSVRLDHLTTKEDLTREMVKLDKKIGSSALRLRKIYLSYAPGLKGI